MGIKSRHTRFSQVNVFFGSGYPGRQRVAIHADFQTPVLIPHKDFTSIYTGSLEWSQVNVNVNIPTYDLTILVLN